MYPHARAPGDACLLHLILTKHDLHVAATATKRPLRVELSLTEYGTPEHGVLPLYALLGTCWDQAMQCQTADAAAQLPGHMHPPSLHVTP